MKNASFPLRPAVWAFLSTGLASQGIVHAQDLDQPEKTGWYTRIGAVARFNVKASIRSITPAATPGVYDDGFVLPDNSGTAGGKTWNWGYNSASQVAGNQINFSRYDSLPGVGTQDVNVSNPTLGGEIIAGYHFNDFKLLKRPARFGIELGYGYSSFSQAMSFAGASTAMHTADGYGLGGVVPPVPPYAGNAAGPGPLLDLNAGSHSVVSSPAASAFDGSLKTSFHNLRIGPALEVDLSSRLSVSLGAGLSSVYADAKLDYTETVSFTNPAMPALAPTNAKISHADWRPGAYAELLVSYRLTSLVGVFVGGDFQFNEKMTFGDAGHEVQVDPGTTFGAKAGAILRF
jgi:hypothetical protein